MKTVFVNKTARMGCMLLILIIICVDQLTKEWIREHLVLYDTIPVINGVFHLTHVQNTGAAFSILQGQRVLFVSITLVVSLVLIGVIWVKARLWNRWLILALTMTAAGGIGNLIDRIARGYVTDFFDFRLIDFAIFNVADIGVVCGSGLLLLYVIVLEPKQENRDGAN